MNFDSDIILIPCGPNPLSAFQHKYGVVKKKVFHESEEKMHKKLKMALQRAKNLVHVKQHYGVSFYEKIFFLH